MSSSDRQAELRRLLSEIPSLRLRPDDWTQIDHLLADIGHGREARVDELSQAVFEGRVRQRFQGRRASADVVPTKQTSVLPAVGVVCGGLLVAVGALLGGGAILVGIVALGVFVFGVAFAGSRIADRSRGTPQDQPDEPPVAIPDEVARRVHALRGGVG